MQILLQAMFVEIITEGKKPNTQKLSVIDGENEVFGELLLPETDLELEVAPDPLLIDTVPVSDMRYPSSIEIPATSGKAEPPIVKLEATTQVPRLDNKYGEIVETAVEIVAGPELAKFEKGERQVDNSSRVVTAALDADLSKPIITASGPSAEVLQPIPTNPLAQPQVLGLEKTADVPSPNLTGKLDYSGDEKGAAHLASQNSLIAEPRSPTEASINTTSEMTDRTDAQPLTSTKVRPTDVMSPATEVAVSKPDHMSPQADQIRSETQRATMPVSAPIEVQPSRETQPRSERREARGTDRQNSARDVPVAAPTSITTPSGAALSIAQPALSLDQKTFGDGGQPMIDISTGLSPRDAEDIRPQTSTPSRIETAARPVITQIVHVMTRANLEGMIEIRLSPEELGRVKLAMSQSEMGITVHVTAERQETLDLMRRNIDMLESDLRDQGFQNLSFSFGQDGTTSGSEDETAPDHDAPSSASGLQAEVAPILAPIQDGRLDIRL